MSMVNEMGEFNPVVSWFIYILFFIITLPLIPLFILIYFGIKEEEVTE